MLGGQTSTLLLTCLSLASLFLSHTFFSPTTSLSLSLLTAHTDTCHHKTGCVVKLPVTMLVPLCHIWALSAVPHTWTTINPWHMYAHVHALACTYTHTHLQTSTHSLHSLLLFLTAAALSLSALRLQANPCQRVILSVSQCVKLFSHMHHSPEPFQILPLT